MTWIFAFRNDNFNAFFPWFVPAMSTGILASSGTKVALWNSYRQLICRTRCCSSGHDGCLRLQKLRQPCCSILGSSTRRLKGSVDRTISLYNTCARYRIFGFYSSSHLLSFFLPASHSTVRLSYCRGHQMDLSNFIWGTPTREAWVYKQRPLSKCCWLRAHHEESQGWWGGKETCKGGLALHSE